MSKQFELLKMSNKKLRL